MQSLVSIANLCRARAPAAFPAFPQGLSFSFVFRTVCLSVCLAASTSIYPSHRFTYNHFSFFLRIRQISLNSCFVLCSNFHGFGFDREAFDLLQKQARFYLFRIVRCTVSENKIRFAGGIFLKGAA